MIPFLDVFTFKPYFKLSDDTQISSLMLTRVTDSGCQENCAEKICEAGSRLSGEEENLIIPATTGTRSGIPYMPSI